jgi:hypothetical protein
MQRELFILLSASSLQDEEDHQRDDQKDSDLCGGGTKGRSKSPARAILASLVVSAAVAFPVSSVHGNLFEI